MSEHIECPKCKSYKRHRSGSLVNYDCGSTLWGSELKQSELCKARAQVVELTVALTASKKEEAK